MAYYSVLSRKQVAEIRRRVAGRESLKSVVDDLGVPYNPAWMAATGKTWQHLQEPPPVNSTRRYVYHNCRICGERYSHRTGGAGRCGRCASYYYRNGAERPTDPLLLKQIKLTRRYLVSLYRRYRDGESVADLAAEAGCSGNAIYNRWNELGLPRRASYRARLDPAKVRQARELYVYDEWRLSDLARRFDVSVPTMRDALIGKTWRTAGGPLPDEETGDDYKCATCGLLCRNPDRVCRYCQEEHGYTWL
jgi:hypothetical protein